MRDWLDEARHSLRQLAARPGFTAVAVAVLALGIGANTAVFSLVNALLLRPAVAVDPHRLVHVHSTDPDGSGFHAFSYLDFLDYQAGAGEALAGLEAWAVAPLAVAGEGEARAALGQVVSAGYFDLFGLVPAAGRFFAAGGETDPVAVVSHSLWQSRLGGREAAVGSTLTVNGHPLTVIGVAPEGFTGPVAAVATEVWVPLSAQPLILPEETVSDRRRVWLELVGRLAPGVDARQAQAGLATVAGRLGEEYPETHQGRGIELSRVGAVPSQVRPVLAAFLAVLMGVVGLVLALTCVNVAGMLLARATERRHEMAVRLALGAGRRRLVRQLLTEGLVLAALGGGLGLALSRLLTGLLVSLDLPLPIPLALDLGIDARVAAFALLATGGTALLFGLAPALQSTRPELVSALKGEETPGRRLGLRRALVVAQIALALLLTVGAGLFLRALAAAGDVDPGLDPRGVSVVSLDLSLNGYDEPAGRELYGRLLERVRRLPGVESASLVRILPLGLANSTSGVRLPDREPPPEGLWPVDVNAVGVGYFETLGIPIRRGRAFGPWDRAEAPPVAVINETMARRLWPGQDPVGRRFVEPTLDDEQEIEVVGVATDGKYRTLGESPRLFVYRPFAQAYSPAMTLAVKGSGEATAAVRRELARLDPGLAVLAAMPLEEAIGLSLLPQQIAAALTAAFGLFGLLLAGVGVYGVTAFLVGQRTREIGVRMALGARPRDVLGLVLRQGATLALTGVALGLAVSLALTRLLAGLLYGVSPTDPSVLAGTALLLSGLALAASWLPARRAAGLDPARALGGRGEGA